MPQPDMMNVLSFRYLAQDQFLECFSLVTSQIVFDMGLCDRFQSDAKMKQKGT